MTQHSIPGAPLNESDYQALEASWIDRSTADKAMLRRVCDLEASEILGRKKVKNCAGIVFPYVLPGDPQVREFRVRVDQPELEFQPDGSSKERNKYLSPGQSRPLLYFPPWSDPRDLANNTLPVVLAEGEKKALALARLATWQAQNARFLPIGIAGVWNWRGTIGITTTAKGDRAPVKGPIPDLNRIIWQQRKVYIVFDANARTNPQVCIARRRLAVELKSRGAEVLLVEIPMLDGVNGIDDFIFSQGPDAALRLIQGAYAADVPNGFSLRESGVYFRESLKDSDGRTTENERFVCSRLEVLAQTRDANGCSWGRLLRWTDPDGNEHRWAMPMAILAGEGTELRQRLMNEGLIISSLKNSRERLQMYVQTANPTTRILCVERTGWHNGTFVLPDEEFGPIDADPVSYQSETPLRHAYKASGTLNEWKEAVGSLCAGNSRLVFSVSVAFAAPLLAPLEEESGGFHLRGPSSIGKTTALVVAGSVWGGGRKEGFVNTWKATQSGVEALAAMHNDALLSLDELGQVDPRDAGDIAYLIAQGQGKTRSNKNVDLRRSLTWNLLFLSSGEVSLAQHMQTLNRKAHGGQMVRLIEISADAGRGLGLFEQLHGRDNAAALAADVKQNALRFYGTPIRHFLQLVACELEGVLQSIHVHRNEFLSRYQTSEWSGEVHRVAWRMSLIAAAGEVASELGVTGWLPGEAAQSAHAGFRSWLHDRGGTGVFDENAAKAQVRLFLEQHGSSRFQSEAKQIVYNQAGYVHEGDACTEYQFMPEVFRTEVCRGYDPDMVLQTLLKAGCLRKGDGGHWAAFRSLPGKGRKRVIVVTSDIFEGEDIDAELQHMMSAVAT